MSAILPPDRRRFLAAAAALVGTGRLTSMGALTRLAACTASRPPVGLAMPSLDGATGWLNSGPLTTAELRGRVVLVDFWTYSCINWLRTLPYVRAWAARYREQGLVTIGVHSPEFGFEKSPEQVARAVRALRVDHPVAIDSDHAIWDAFDNAYWPALYLVDAQGTIRYVHPGEGEYERSERFIQRLLSEAGATGVARDVVTVTARGAEADADWGQLRSPESYVGYSRSERFASPGGAAIDRSHRYVAPARLGLNEWALAGDWIVGAEAARVVAPHGRIAFRFHARDLHLVMGATTPGARVAYRVLIDGQPPGPAHGVDLDARGVGIVSEPRLHQLVRQPRPIRDRRFEIEFVDAGVEAFSFTFG